MPAGNLEGVDEILKHPEENDESPYSIIEKYFDEKRNNEDLLGVDDITTHFISSIVIYLLNQKPQNYEKVSLCNNVCSHLFLELCSKIIYEQHSSKKPRHCKSCCQNV